MLLQNKHEILQQLVEVQNRLLTSYTTATPTVDVQNSLTLDGNEVMKLPNGRRTRRKPTFVSRHLSKC